LIPALLGGRAAIAAFSKEANKLTDDDLAAISKTKAAWEGLENWALVVSGKVLTGARMMYDDFKAGMAAGPGSFAAGWAANFMARKNGVFDTSEEGAEGGGNKEAFIALLKKASDIREEGQLKELSETDKLNALREKSRQLASDYDKAQNDSIDQGNIIVELAKNQNEIEKATRDVKKEQAEQAKKDADDAQKRIIETRNMQREINNAEMAEQDVIDAKRQAHDALTKLTLSELASSHLNFKGVLGQDQWAARRIAVLDKQREWNREHGFYDAAEARQTEIERLKGTLSGNVQFNDRQSMDRKNNEAISKSAEHLGDLVALAKDKGLAVTVKEIQLSP
jgi:hypothetical protein